MKFSYDSSEFLMYKMFENISGIYLMYMPSVAASSGSAVGNALIPE